MALPFLPPGQTSLPAERFVLFADPSNDVQRIDEASVQKDGGSFTSEWQSGTLNRVEEGKIFELALLDLFYSAFATTISVAGSGDGGETFGPNQTVNLILTPDKIETVRVGIGVTGTDLRFRILFNTDILVNIYGFRPHLVERGDLIF
jgi:hypothetical protein